MLMRNLTLARPMPDLDSWTVCPTCHAVWLYDPPDECPECLVPVVEPEEISRPVEIGGEG